MKARKKGLLILAMAVMSLTGCKGDNWEPPEDIDEFPYPAATADKDSWLQWQEYDDNIIDIDWYVDLTSFSYNNATMVAKEIKEKTGINIRFQAPSTADGSKLSTMISGNKLPDVVSVAANLSDRALLAEDGSYIWSIDDLAERWAPSLLERLDPEIRTYYKASDAKLYGIPQYFYTTKALEEMQTLHSSYLTNGGIVARKDYLDAYHEAMRAENPMWDESSVCNPQGVLEMAKWVKNHFNLSNSNPTIMLSPFENQRTHGSVGLRWLMEYFGVPEEGADGHWTYQWEQPEFKEMMDWLNDCYTNHLLQTSDFTNTSAQCQTNIQKGLPFIVIASPQNFLANFKNWILSNPKGEDAAYVPIIFGNSSGKVPQLAITGNSYFFNMISKNCKRPDRVIKLFDFLYSDEGQRLMYFGKEASGPEAEDGTFYYVKRPGETGVENGKPYTYKNGLIAYTDKVRDELTNLAGSQYGFSTPSIALSGSYMYITDHNHGSFNSYSGYVQHNLKAAILPYGYIYRGMEFELDPTLKNYTDVVNIEANLRLLWIEYYKEIICAKNNTVANQIIEDTLASARRRGLEELKAAKDHSFMQHKKDYSITFANPQNDPNNLEYKALRLTSIYGDPSLNKTAPDWIIRK